jgi:hypothetical protein
MRSVISGAELYPDSIVLLGAAPDYAEVEYGWIEPGPAISHARISLLSVNRFWEKPSLPQARALLHRGCLWNTFVTAGRASTFIDLLGSQVPDVVLSLNKALAEMKLEVAYQAIPSVDFSRQVFVPQPHRLLAVRDTALGWADLGSPARVMDILTRNNIEPTWLRDEHSLSLFRSAGFDPDHSVPKTTRRKISQPVPQGAGRCSGMKAKKQSRESYTKFGASRSRHSKIHSTQDLKTCLAMKYALVPDVKLVIWRGLKVDTSSSRVNSWLLTR